MFQPNQTDYILALSIDIRFLEEHMFQPNQTGLYPRFVYWYTLSWRTHVSTKPDWTISSLCLLIYAFLKNTCFNQIRLDHTVTLSIDIHFLEENMFQPKQTGLYPRLVYWYTLCLRTHVSNKTDWTISLHCLLIYAFFKNTCLNQSRLDYILALFTDIRFPKEHMFKSKQIGLYPCIVYCFTLSWRTPV